MAIFVRSHIPSLDRPDLNENPDCEAVFADLQLPNRTLLVGSVYFSPDAKCSAGLRELLPVLEQTAESRAFFCGDYNAHHPVWDPQRFDSCPRWRLLEPAAAANNFFISNTNTHTYFPPIVGHRSSNLDLALVSTSLAPHFNTTVTDYLSGHHRPLIHTIFTEEPVPTAPRAPWRFRTANPGAFADACVEAFDDRADGIDTSRPNGQDALTEAFTTEFVAVCTATVG